jgi:hypothetical protein
VIFRRPHDTRALAIANLLAGMELGVDRFDIAVGGMGGCPFAAHKGAAGNVCTEDVVFLCQELGIETGIDLDRLIEAAKLAERVVGHELPGKLKQGGNLATYRARARAAAPASSACGRSPATQWPVSHRAPARDPTLPLSRGGRGACASTSPSTLWPRPRSASAACRDALG